MKWIGLTGRAGSGKDYTFTELRKLLPELHRVSFADGLRYDIEDILEEQIPALWQKPYPPEIRKLLQWWGTELRREENKNFWVNRAEGFAMQAMERGQTPVFTDVRFPNEAEMIEDNGGIIVRVSAPLLTRQRRLGTLPPEHASEVEADSIPVVYEHVSTPSKSYERSLHRILVEARVDDLMEDIIESFN